MSASITCPLLPLVLRRFSFFFLFCCAVCMMRTEAMVLVADTLSNHFICFLFLFKFRLRGARVGSPLAMGTSRHLWRITVSSFLVWRFCAHGGKETANSVHRWLKSSLPPKRKRNWKKQMAKNCFVSEGAKLNTVVPIIWACLCKSVSLFERVRWRRRGYFTSHSFLYFNFYWEALLFFP